MRSELDEAQPTLVLIHGIGQDRNAWQFLDLARFGAVNVQAYELPGHGETPRQPGMTWTSLADDLVAQYEGPLDLVSVGATGEIVLNALVRHSRRIRSAVIRSGGRLGLEETNEAVRAERIRRADAAMARGMQSFIDEAVIRWFGDAAAKSSTPAMQYVRKTLSNMTPQALADAQYADLLGQPVRHAQLSGIMQPITLIRVISEHPEQPVRTITGSANVKSENTDSAALLHSMLSNSRVLEIAGTSTLHLSNPERLTSAIDDHLKWVAKSNIR